MDFLTAVTCGLSAWYTFLRLCMLVLYHYLFRITTDRIFPHIARFFCVTTTVMSIVTADIHQGLQQSPFHLAIKQRRCLTFWHWSGVTPYTSTYVFAGSCVFGKQLPEILSLRPLRKEGQALSRSYGCFFAEFLGDHSLVRLGLLDLITCVGLRYGFYIHKFREFSWKRALYHYPVPKNWIFHFS